MKLAVAVLCTDMPTQQSDGRTEVRGIYHRLVTHEFPTAMVGWLYVAFRLGPEEPNTMQVTFDLQLIHESGAKGALAPWTANVDRRRGESLGSIFSVVDARGVQIAQPGLHEFVVWANMHQVASVPFLVQHT